MDCSQEIQHWLARNNLQELAPRFQTHKITSLRRLYFLNQMLIKELIPEIGLRMDFLDCWSQFKLRGTLRDELEQCGPKYPPTPITYQNSQGRPMEVFELHTLQQGANVNFVNYTPRQNISQEERYNVAVPDLPSRNISYDDARTVVNKSPAGSVEIIEEDPISQEYNVTAIPPDIKPRLCTQDPNRIANIPDKAPFELILGHYSENGNISTLQDKPNLIQNHFKAHNNSQVLPDEDVQLLSSEVRSIDSGWGSNYSNVQNPVSVKQNKRKADKTESSNSGNQSKSYNSSKHSKSIKPYDSIKELDLRSYLMNFSVKSKAVVESYQKNGFLFDKERSVICNAVARRLLVNKMVPYVEYRKAAEKICECFPSESEVMYYCPAVFPRKAATGKLPNKVHALRAYLKQNKKAT